VKCGSWDRVRIALGKREEMGVLVLIMLEVTQSRVAMRCDRYMKYRHGMEHTALAALHVFNQF